MRYFVNSYHIYMMMEGCEFYQKGRDLLWNVSKMYTFIDLFFFSMLITSFEEILEFEVWKCSDSSMEIGKEYRWLEMGSWTLFSTSDVGLDLRPVHHRWSFFATLLFLMFLLWTDYLFYSPILSLLSCLRRIISGVYRKSNAGCDSDGASSDAGVSGIIIVGNDDLWRLTNFVFKLSDATSILGSI